MLLASFNNSRGNSRNTTAAASVVSSSSDGATGTITGTGANCSEWLLLPAHRHNDDDGAQHVACLAMSDVFVALTLIVIIFLTVVGNTLVVLSVAIYKRMRTFTNVLLVSLASADLLVGVLVMPIALVDLMQNHHWTFGRGVCKFWTTSDVFLCTASILNLCVISLDRYFAITSPLVYTRTRSHKLAVALVAAVWLLSMVTCSPPLLVPGWQFRFDQPYACGYVKAIAYRIYSALCSFYIPLLIMLSVYLKIFRVANNREKMMKTTTNSQNRRSSRGMQIWQGGSVSSKSGGSVIRSTTSVVGRYKTILANQRQGSRSKRAYSSATCNSTGGDERADTPSPTRRYRSVEMDQSTVNEISCVEDTVTCTEYCSRTTNRESTVSASNENLNGVGRNSTKRVRLIMTDNDGNAAPLLVTTPSLETRSWSSSASLHELIKTKISGSSTTSNRSTREKLMYLKERKALKTIGVVVSGFIVCWLPFFVLYIVEVVCDASGSSASDFSTAFSTTNFTDHLLSSSSSSSSSSSLSSSLNRTSSINSSYGNMFGGSNITNLPAGDNRTLCKIPPILADIFLWLGYSNSAINPLIYTFYHKDYRRCFKDLLSCGCLRRKVNRRMSVRRLHQTRL